MRPFTLFLGLIVAILVSCVAEQARAAQAVYKSGDLTITLLQADCDVPPLTEGITAAESKIPPKRAIIRMGQTEVPACWGVFEDKVLIADVLGNAGFVLMKDFKDDPGV